ncbi:GNAT family N-acetyltransferase [Pseudomonas cerasi]
MKICSLTADFHPYPIAFIDFAAEQIGATYLVAVADPENTASQRVMQRLGMVYKAIERHYEVPCVVYELSIQRT